MLLPPSEHTRLRLVSSCDSSTIRDYYPSCVVISNQTDYQSDIIFMLEPLVFHAVLSCKIQNGQLLVWGQPTVNLTSEKVLSAQITS